MSHRDLEFGIRRELNELYELTKKDVVESLNIKMFRNASLLDKLNLKVVVQVCDNDQKLLSQSSKSSESTIGELLDAF